MHHLWALSIGDKRVTFSLQIFLPMSQKQSKDGEHRFETVKVVHRRDIIPIAVLLRVKYSDFSPTMRDSNIHRRSVHLWNAKWGIPEDSDRVRSRFMFLSSPFSQWSSEPSSLVSSCLYAYSPSFVLWRRKTYIFSTFLPDLKIYETAEWFTSDDKRTKNNDTNFGL